MTFHWLTYRLIDSITNFTNYQQTSAEALEVISRHFVLTQNFQTLKKFNLTFTHKLHFFFYLFSNKKLSNERFITSMAVSNISSLFFYIKIYRVRDFKRTTWSQRNLLFGWTLGMRLMLLQWHFFSFIITDGRKIAMEARRLFFFQRVPSIFQDEFFKTKKIGSCIPFCLNITNNQKKTIFR